MAGLSRSPTRHPNLLTGATIPNPKVIQQPSQAQAEATAAPRQPRGTRPAPRSSRADVTRPAVPWWPGQPASMVTGVDIWARPAAQELIGPDSVADPSRTAGWLVSCRGLL